MHGALFGKTDCVDAVIRHHSNKLALASTALVDTKLKDLASCGARELKLESYDPRLKAGDLLVLAPGTPEEEKESVADHGPPVKIKGKLRHAQYALAR